MLKKLRTREGFTLIELMIVVAILGILAAVAVPAFLKYIRDSKTAEAEENLKSLGDGAITYYQEEHADTTGLTVTTRVYPPSGGGTLETAGADPNGSKVNPSSTDWTQWNDLRFSLSKPHYYQYQYTQQASGKEFTAGAVANLGGSGSGIDSQFEVRGSTNTSTNGPEVTAAIEIQ